MINCYSIMHVVRSVSAHVVTPVIFNFHLSPFTFHVSRFTFHRNASSFTWRKPLTKKRRAVLQFQHAVTAEAIFIALLYMHFLCFIENNSRTLALTDVS